MNNRPILYDYEQGRTFDILSAFQYAMKGDTDVGAAVLMGNASVASGAMTTVVAGGEATATSPASLSINIAPAAIFQPAAIDATAYGALSANTTPIYQLGVLDSATTLQFTLTNLAAGQSQWALVEAQFVSSDSVAANDPNGGLLLYYNSTNPLQPYQGQNNNGQVQNTLRTGLIQFNIVLGTPATSGDQVPPNPDSGWVPLYLIELTYGMTQITTILTCGPSVGQNVPSSYPNAPLLAGLLNSHHGGIAGQAPKIILTNGEEVQGILPLANFAQPAKNMWVANVPGTNTFTVPANVTTVKVRQWGAGGGGGGSYGAASGGGGGGAGAYAEGVYAVTPGQQITATVGAGGAGGNGSPTAGSAGGTSSFGSLVTCTGGNGGSAGSSALATSAGSGGAPSGGQFQVPGNAGELPALSGSNGTLCGMGASAYGTSKSYYVSGTVAQNGGAPAGPGGGGGGGINGGAGAAGANGGIIVEW